MFDLGDVIPLSVNTYNNATPPVLASAGSVALIVTAPSAAYVIDPVAPTSTGVYVYNFTPTEAGRHTVRWVATGTNASAYTDEFEVVVGNTGGVPLADVKAHLNFHGVATTNDEELRNFILTATRIVENVVGSINPVTKTEIVGRYGTTDTLALLFAPVLSVTSVTSYGGAVIDVTTLRSDFTQGLLRFTPPWSYFVTPATVVYRVGRLSVPAEVRMAILDLVRINWRPQQGGNRSAYDEATDSGPGSYELGFFVPNGVIGSLSTERLPGVVA